MTSPTIHDWLHLRLGNQRRRAESDAAERAWREAEQQAEENLAEAAKLLDAIRPAAEALTDFHAKAEVYRPVAS